MRTRRQSRGTIWPAPERAILPDRGKRFGDRLAIAACHGAGNQPEEMFRCLAQDVLILFAKRDRVAALERASQQLLDPQQACLQAAVAGPVVQGQNQQDCRKSNRDKKLSPWLETTSQPPLSPRGSSAAPSASAVISRPSVAAI